jgi:acetyltransferase-like isoleucine patch superfamily enzyme
MKAFVFFKRNLRLAFALIFASIAVLLTKLTMYFHVAQLLSLVPFRTGNLVRYYFYKWTLSSCGDDVVISFGTVISYTDVNIGNHVHIGDYNSIGLVDIGDYTQTAQFCSLLSGARHHEFSNTDIPIMKQPSHRDRIKVGPDVWIGANVTVMANVGKGCVIGAGSVATKDVPDFSVAAGNPARIIRTRK